MGKLVYINDNGEAEVLAENVSRLDVLLRTDYFATKLWCRDDLVAKLEEDFDITENVEAICDEAENTGILRALNDCTDEDWDVIHYALETALENLKVKYKTAEMIITEMNEPTEWVEGTVFSCQLDFNNPETGKEDQTSFDVDCTNPLWRDELLQLWYDFAEENGYDKDCLTDAWSTVEDEV